MGFDIFLVRSRFRDETVEKKNPFTGEVMSVRSHEPLSDPELQAVRRVLRSAGATEPDEFGFSVIQFGDGGAAEVQMSRLDEGCTVILRTGRTADCLRFLLDLLRAPKTTLAIGVLYERPNRTRNR
jgi:hypothetical protein